MSDDEWGAFGDDSLTGRHEPPSEVDRARLRDVLGFPESVEGGDAFERPSHRERTSERRTATPEPSPNVEERADGDDVGRRVQQLTMRVEALAGLVETLFDRLEASGAGADATLTAEELADIAARMVRMIEVRLEAQSERLERALHSPELAVVDADGKANVSLIDDHLAMIGRSIIEMRKAITDLQAAPSEMQEMAILAHFDRWFEESNTRQATDVEHLRRDLHRFDETLVEVKAAMSQLLALPMGDGTGEQFAAARLDASIIQQVAAQLEETSEAMAEKLEEQLASRVQRFEALSQAMMTMVGDPVDALSAKLAQVVRTQEGAPNVLQSIGELTQIQSQLAAAIGSLRQDALERDALLRRAIEKLDRLTASE